MVRCDDHGHRQLDGSHRAGHKPATRRSAGPRRHDRAGRSWSSPGTSCRAPPPPSHSTAAANSPSRSRSRQHVVGHAASAAAIEPAAGAERDEDLAAAVCRHRPGAGQPEPGPASDTFALPPEGSARRSRSRRCNCPRVPRVRRCAPCSANRCPTGEPSTRQSLERSEVGQHERAENVTIDDTRGGADATLPTEARHPRPGADRTGREQPVDGGGECLGRHDAAAPPSLTDH